MYSKNTYGAADKVTGAELILTHAMSGGKDSAALAIYLKQKNKEPDIEYFFTDTGVELPEIYTFLDFILR
jgi:3'-phosphoadenosine 5'-phosphosulfate sulfotransferase (PAPS reductase)/FAD synthetase